MNQIIQHLTSSAARMMQAAKFTAIGCASAALLAALTISSSPARWVLAGLLFAVGAIVAVVLYRGAGRKVEMIAALRENPRSLVWTYPHNTRSNGQITRQVMLARRDGASCTIPAPTEAHQKNLIAEILASNPTVVIGYSPERAEAFTRDPASLQ